MSKWKIVNHPVIPGMVIIEGPAFRLVIATQAVGITSWNRRERLAGRLSVYPLRHGGSV